MSNKMPAVWALEPHTRAKHFILRNYLRAWFPIMGSWQKKLLYVDAYSGPGIYEQGEKGSPTLALREALNYRDSCMKNGWPQREIHLLFVEEDEKRVAILREEIGKVKIPRNITVTIKNSTFEETTPDILKFIDDNGGRNVPCFAFIDPFGYDLPFELIERLMSNDLCEVFINFMFEWINRFIERDGQDAVMSRLFGTGEYKSIELAGPDRHHNIRDFYQRQLETRVARYVRYFEMAGKTGTTKYYLFHATKHHKGLQKMKEAMWKVSPGGDFFFSDATDPSQVVLFGDKPDFMQLKRIVLENFSGIETTIEEVEHYVLTQTPFLPQHIRRPVLKPMERDGQILVTESNRKVPGAFPPGTRMKFL